MTDTQKETHREPRYMLVWLWLLILTVLELVAVYLRLPRGIFVTVLVILALMKAALVAAYFMHLRFERLTLVFIALAPLIFGVILLVGLMPDSLWRIVH